MKRLILALLATVPLWAQCPTGTAYPGALDTDATLTVAGNNTGFAGTVAATLASSVLAGNNVLVVSYPAGFTQAFLVNMTVTVDVYPNIEVMFVTNVNGQNLTVSRACEGTTAIAHAAGVPIVNNATAYAGHTSITSAVKAIETALGASFAIPVPINKGGTNATTQAAALTNLLGSSIVPVTNGGTGVSAAQGNGTKVQLSTGTTTTNDFVTYDANGNTKDSALSAQGNGSKVQLASTISGVAGTPLCVDANGNDTTSGCANSLPSATGQLQYLRTQPNTGNNTTLQFSTVPVINSPDYNFPAQSPGGSLSVGNNTITMTPVPLGVNGTDLNHFLYVSGGVGTAEACLINGGAGTSGQSSGAIQINCANTHTGAWTVQSATAGIQEAANLSPSIYIPDGTYQMQSAVTFTGDTHVFCASNHAILNANVATQNIFVSNVSTIFQRFRVTNCNFTAGLTKTAGDAIQLNGTGGISSHGAVMDSIECQQQWNCIHSVTAGHWSVVSAQILSGRNFDIYIQNTNGTDAGDNSIVNSYLDNSNASIGEGIHWESGGGLYVANTKIVNHITGIYLRAADGVNTSDFMIANNSIELFSGVAIGLVRLGTTGLIQSVVITGNQMSTAAAGTYGIISGAGTTNVVISGNIIGAILGGVNVSNTAGALIQGNKILNATTGIGLATGNSGLLEVFNNQMASVGTAYSGTAVYEDIINGLTFAQITAAGIGPTNGSQVFCSDCNATCAAGASTGRTCFRENGAWIH